MMLPVRLGSLTNFPANAYLPRYVEEIVPNSLELSPFPNQKRRYGFSPGMQGSQLNSSIRGSVSSLSASTAIRIYPKMEESEKKKKMMDIMQMEATRLGKVDDPEASTTHNCLSSPLIECTVTPPAKNMIPRFGSYTHPVSDFSSSKKRRIDINQMHLGYPSTPTSASLHMPFSMSHSDPRRCLSPFQSPVEGSLKSSSGGSSSPWRSPTSNRVFSWSSQSPHSGSSKGGSSYTSSNIRTPGSARSRGSSKVSARMYPDRFYKNSMVEDPWKHLKLVIRTNEDDLKIPGSLQSWLPKSSSAKKPQMGEDAMERTLQRVLGGENLSQS